MNTEPSIWIVLVLNGILIAFVITIPVLVGFMFISFAKKASKKDREEFDSKVISLLEEIRDAQKRPPL